MKLSRIDGVRCTVGEGPVWDMAEQALYLMDIGQQKILRYRPGEESLSSWTTPLPPVAMALREGGAIIAMKNTVYAMNFGTGECLPMAVAEDQPAEATFNDGKVDRQGRFIVGSCTTNFKNPQPIGGIYSLGLDAKLRRLAGDIAFSNSSCFSPDGSTFYFSDGARHQLYSYDYDRATGQVGERRCLANTLSLGGMPDGATVDSDGLIWVAIMEGAKVAAFRPDGQLERVVELPVSLPASVMFGGPNLEHLFVTTIDPAYFGRPTQDGAGFLYCVEGLGSKGLPELRFAG